MNLGCFVSLKPGKWATKYPLFVAEARRSDGVVLVMELMLKLDLGI